ncbi:MAG: M12 family metallo-peptidase [Acidobacteriota bacterium]
MKRSRLIWLALVLFLSAAAIFSVAADTSPSKFWQKLAATFARVSPSQTAQTTASQYTFQLPPNDVQRILAGAPIESPGTRASSSPTVLRLPHPDGKMRQFRLLESPLLTPEMAAQYPDIKSYTAQGVDDPAATARFSWTSRGLHGIIVGNDYSVFIHPVDHRTTTNYVSYFAPQDERFECGVKDSTPGLRGRTATPGINSMNGGTLRTYRLALTAPAEYTLDPTLGGGTVASTVASFNVWLNQVNAVYEREMSIRFTLVNNTSIIYTNATTDPFTNPTDTVTSLTEVRDLLRTQVGIANYDLGHVLLVGDTGGVAFLGVTCDGSGSANKGGGVSGVPAPLGYAFGASRIMHEMGHQFGATHTFNDIAACASNRAANTAYEPGNGMTIMAYPVQCITPIVPNRELRFHDGSLTQMVNFLGSLGGTCATTMATGNTPPTVSGGPDRTIPRNTPFTLTATGSDPDVNDAANLTYVWEQIDAGGALYGQTTDVASFTDVGDPSTTTRPIFRPFSPSPNPTRTFPSLTYILNNANVPPGIVSGYYTAESLPNVTRTLNFRVTLRDNRAGGGGFSDDHVALNVDGNSGPFLVTAPNTAVSLPAGSLQTVTWNVNNTNLAPVNCANVKISLSTDGGQTFPTVLAASTPNDGSEVITLPSLTATVSTARIKVEAVGNIFFDLSDANFTISSGTSCPNVTSFAPGAGNTGTSVKIFGTGFTGVTAVKFSNNVSASFTVNSDTQITVTQPAGAASGPLTLSKAGCADTLTANYLVCSTLAGTLTVDDGTYEQVNVGRFLVNRLTPASYPATLQSISVRIASTQYLQVGTPLTLLAGVNADGDTNINNTSFQTSNVTVTAVNTFVKYDLAQPITIYAGDFVVGYTFPNGGATASLDITSPDNRSYSSEDGLNFSVNTSADYLIRAGYLTGCGLGVSACPTVSGISPANGQIGDTVTINGTGFSGVTSVTFNNNLVTNFTIVSETQITAVVPAGATTGPITLSEPNCADVQSTNFVVDTPVCPTVTGFNPPSGQAGDTVVITGSNFTGVTVVKFAGDAAATFTVDSPTQITATIPTGAQYGPISISKQGCANAQTANFVPCNSTFPLQIDDGSPNTNGGFTGPTTPYYVSRLTPVTYPATLTTVSININSTSVPVGTPITILAGTNTDGDTNINGTTFQTLSATHISAGQYNSYTLTTPVTINAGDFVIGFSLSIPTGSTWFPESRDTDNPQGRSYRSTNSGSTYSLATGNANYLIRGQYYRPCCETLTITTQPSNQVACAGAPASFSVVATGSNLSYQWRKNGSNIVGATSNSYSIPAVAAGDVGSYDVVITNSCNSTVTSNAATLALNPTTAITAPPVNQTVCEGGPASFSVTATGTGLSYQWRKNGAPISGATNSSFAIPAAAAADAGSYDVVVTGSCGTVTSSAATLTVNSGAAITAPPVNQTVREGGPASFSDGATGAGLSYQWRKNGAPIGGATNSSFAIPAAAAADAGSYDVIVTGSCGTVTSSAATNC